jgi:lactate 2-monooxygenase
VNRPRDASRRQATVYLSRIQGVRPRIPFDPAALERAAQSRMSRDAFAYVAGGAGTEATMRANRAAFDRWSIRQRVLRDVSTRNLSVRLFGRQLPTPFLFAPIGVLELAHRSADSGLARAAARLGIPPIFSNQASVPFEQAAVLTGKTPFFFQLYYSKNDELVASFVRRAESAGAAGIVVTLDTTMLGWRPRDLERISLPFLLGKGIAAYTSDPVFRTLVEHASAGHAGAEDAAPESPDDRSGDSTRILSALGALLSIARHYPGGRLANLFSPEPRRAVQAFIDTYTRPSLTWDDIDRLHTLTRLPIILKGVLHPDDARRALAHGVAGIIVSNHGGRQVDGAMGALDALPEVVAAVGGAVPVLFDSGIRCAADAFKALALGAEAVCIGRPYVYALSLQGERGVVELMENLSAEIELTMALAGLRSWEEVGAHALVRAPGAE